MLLDESKLTLTTQQQGIKVRVAGGALRRAAGEPPGPGPSLCGAVARRRLPPYRVSVAGKGVALEKRGFGIPQEVKKWFRNFGCGRARDR